MFSDIVLPLSFQARHNGQNYVFALLTGYRDPPAGVSVFPPLILFSVCKLIVNFIIKITL